MGGLAFIAAALVTGIVACVVIFLREGAEDLPSLVLTLALATASGLIGVIDDRAKLRKKQNEGLLLHKSFCCSLSVPVCICSACADLGKLRPIYISLIWTAPSILELPTISLRCFFCAG